MNLTPTTLDVLGEAFAAKILGITPRVTYQGDQPWRRYDHEAATAASTRRFRLVWETGSFVRGGIFTPQAVEAEALLKVRTDYAGQHELLMPVVQDDHHQVRDQLHTLTADGANGLVLVQALRVEVPGRPDRRDVFQVNHVYQVRYLQARG